MQETTVLMLSTIASVGVCFYTPVLLFKKFLSSNQLILEYNNNIEGTVLLEGANSASDLLTMPTRTE